MTFIDTPAADGTSLLDEVRQASLPARDCISCHTRIARRAPRVTVRASWRPSDDVLCTECWHSICEYAKRFMLDQLTLPL